MKEKIKNNKRKGTKKLYKVFLWSAFGIVVAAIGGHPLYQERVEPLLELSGKERIINYVILGIGILIVIFALDMLVDIFVGYDREVKRFLAKNEDVSRERLYLFLEETEESSGLQINEEFIFMNSGGTAYYLAKSKQLVWAYKKVVTDQKHGFTRGTYYSINIYFLNRQYHCLRMENEGQCAYVLNKISEFCPKAIIGYNKDLEELMYRNTEAFLDVRYHKPIAAREVMEEPKQRWPD